MARSARITDGAKKAHIQNLNDTMGSYWSLRAVFCEAARLSKKSWANLVEFNVILLDQISKKTGDFGIAEFF